MTTQSPTMTIADGVDAPQLALGTWPMDDDEVAKALTAAFEIGYRHVDTAENYENERGVGRAIRESGLPREDVFVTTKFNKVWHGDPAAGVQANLDRLGLDHLDLVLIHWPNPDQDLYVTAWKGLIALRDQGVVRAIGTSNFKPEHLDRLERETGVLPAVNQIELHPYLDRSAERAYHRDKGIVTEAWSPLGRGNGLLDEPVVRDLAEKYGRTPGQILLRWDVELGLMTAPKSSDPERLAQNLDVFSFTLDPAEVDSLTALHKDGIEPVDSATFGH